MNPNNNSQHVPDQQQQRQNLQILQMMQQQQMRLKQAQSLHQAGIAHPALLATQQHNMMNPNIMAQQRLQMLAMQQQNSALKLAAASSASRAHIPMQTHGFVPQTSVRPFPATNVLVYSH